MRHRQPFTALNVRTATRPTHLEGALRSEKWANSNYYKKEKRPSIIHIEIEIETLFSGEIRPLYRSKKISN